MSENEPRGGNGRRAALAEAITRVYGIFSRYKLEGPVSGALCCISGDAGLVSKPLKLLEGCDLEHFASRAVTTHGTLDDFKHFLPRILELTTFECDVGSTDIEIVFGKLHYSDWQSWPLPERKAVRDFMHAMWLNALGQFPGSLDADKCLCAIANAENDLRPYLDEWQSDGFAATRHLAKFMIDQSQQLLKSGKLQNAFWWHRTEQMTQVIEWILDPAVAQKLQEAFFACQDLQAAAELSHAVQNVDSLRKRNGESRTSQ